MKNWSEINHRLLPIVDNIQIAQGTYLLSFERDFDFLAGQVVALGVNTTAGPRLYSIASGENDEVVDILYTEKSGGLLTPMLSKLEPGDKVLVSEPFGTFTEVSHNAVYICAGTGIAPFVAKIKSLKGFNPTLIHGASFPEYFYFKGYLELTLGRNYIQCCSRYPSDDHYQGRVTQFVSEWKNLDISKRYYLCGSAEMVVDTRDELIARGIPFGNISAEIYF